MSKTDETTAKLAPIFDLKLIKRNSKVDDESGGNKRKRNKKSSKSDGKIKIHNKPNNNYGNVDNDNTPEDCRRSKRLRNKDIETEVIISYNEDSDEEVVGDKQFENSVEIIDKLNESVILLEEEESNTIDYWTEHKTDEDIEIVSSDSNSVSSCQTTQEPVISFGSQSEEMKDCLLWTEKYKPINSMEVIGHKVAVDRLKSWLEVWGKSHSNRDQYESDDDSDNSLDESNSCLLICGPTGSGKTSMVYAIAEELKYKVLELNASMKRNGRIISKILGEATQSHQMQRNTDINGLTPSIHSFFNNTIKRVDNDIKVLKPNKKMKPKPKGILNYFRKQTDNCQQNCEDIEVIEQKIVDKIEIQLTNDPELKTNDKSSNDCPLFAPKALSIATNSLILFDDIDVMIDEDLIGFWNAFNRINETTKKPVILTATQYVPYIKSNVNRLQVLTINKPNPSDTIDGLKSICDKEVDDNDYTVSQDVCRQLVTAYDYDIRRCLNQLQFGTDWQQNDKSTEVLTGNKLDITSFYDSLLLSDVMQTQFGILGYSDNRTNWMKCKPTFNENESQSKDMAKDLIETIDELNYNINRRKCKSMDISKPFDSQTFEAISLYLSPNLSLRTIVMDYCPYLALICDSESIRQSKLANHSRRLRRFMHHLDSIGFHVDSLVKVKLISSFISDEFKTVLDMTINESDSVPQKDDDVYE